MSHGAARRLAALTIAVLAGVGLAACSASTPGKPAAPTGSATTMARPYTRVVCRTSGASATPDRGVLLYRAQRLGGAKARVTAEGGSVTIDLPGTPAATSRSGLCSSSVLNFRGVIAPPVAVTCSAAACTAHPLTSAATAGKFTLPTTDADYTKLSAANQKLIGTALAGFDCASVASEPDQATGDYIACASGSTYGASTNYVAFLVGPVIVAGTDIDNADAVAPNQSTQWTVSLTLKSSAAAAWAAYTGKHNVGGSANNSASVTSCGPTSFPCADYVAFTVDGTVISAPVNESTINGLATQISGGFTRTSAKDLAARLTGGPLSVALTTVSTTVVR